MVFQQELQFKVELRIVGREIKRRKKNNQPIKEFAVP